MIFHNPEYQILFLIIPALIFVYIYARSCWRRYCGRAAGGSGFFLQVRGDSVRHTLRIGCVLLAVTFLIIALMRPRWGAREVHETELGVDISITLDISRSMLAKDIMPSRLERVRAELSSLLRLLDGNRFSLVLFAGTAFIQCPLTADHSTVYEFIASASPAMISLQGTNIEDALEKAARSLESRFKRNRVILLISDGESHEGDALNLAGELSRDKGISIFTLGVGTPEGSDIRDDTGEKLDKSGRTVITKLDETFMRKLAETGGGRYYSLGSERFDVAALVRDIDSIEKSGLLLLRPESLIDRYPFFVFMAFAFFTLALWMQEKKS